MTVQAYDKLSQAIRQRVENSYQQPSAKSFIAKMVLSLLMPAGASLLLHTSLGKMRVVDLTRLGVKTKIMTLVFIAKFALFSMVYHILKLGNQENRARMEAIRSLLSEKLKENQYVAIQLDTTTYCIDSKEVTPQDRFDVKGKQLVKASEVLKEHAE